MSYLSYLETDKKAREKYEEDSLKLKELIFEINCLYSKHDGEFIKELQKFVNSWKQ